MKTIGTIGGMGPAATSDLYSKIIAATAAGTDREHIHVLIDGNTAIPDRTAAILCGGENPVPELCRSAQRLENAGAELLMMACNTAHYFYDAVARQVSVPFLHMPRETAMEASRRKYKRVALLATDGTCAAGIYQRAFEEHAGEIALLLPQEKEQQEVMNIIYKNVKAGCWNFPKEQLTRLLSAMEDRGAEAFILGCTELPIAFSHFEPSVQIIDPTEVLARAAVLSAGALLR